MSNLKSIIKYECITSFRYIWIFYGIQYLFIGFISLTIGMVSGSFDKIGSMLEINTLVYIGILGVLGFKEDFKMLIQNGFTRKYIFTATISMFTFIAGTMALVDVIVGNLLHSINCNYSSLFGSLYGYGNIFMNWLWLLLLYVMFCCLLYLVILVINKVGKTAAIYLGIICGGIIILILALFRYVFTGAMIKSILEFLMKSMGFMANGSINYIFPSLTLLAIGIVLGTLAYVVIRRTELK